MEEVRRIARTKEFLNNEGTEAEWNEWKIRKTYLDFSDSAALPGNPNAFVALNDTTNSILFKM